MALNYAGIHLVAENYVNRPKSQQPYTSKMAETIHGASAYVISRKVENKYKEQFEHLCASPHVVRIRDILNRSRAKFGTGEIAAEAEADAADEDAEGAEEEAEAEAPPAPRAARGGGGGGGAEAKDAEGDDDDGEDEAAAAGGGGGESVKDRERAARTEQLNTKLAAIAGGRIKVIKGKGSGFQPAIIKEGAAVGYLSAEVSSDELQTMVEGFTALRKQLVVGSKEYQDATNYIQRLTKEKKERH